MSDVQANRVKKVYRTPALVVYGDIRAITQTSTMGSPIIDGPTDPDHHCDGMKGPCMTA